MDNEALILDLVEWVGQEPRGHAEVMDAWRTSCPRLTVWEDSVDAGLVRVAFDGKARRIVSITSKGRKLLQRAGRSAVAPETPDTT